MKQDDKKTGKKKIRKKKTGQLKKTASKKAASKKAASKKAASKKAASKKTASKKTASKKTASKKIVSKKIVSKKIVSKKILDIRTVAWVRNNWVEFFKKHDHLHISSASLIPTNDPTLLFTTAGMVQFKTYFSGIEKPPASRVVTIQKSLRTTDLESVGKTARHCTFFEMLGNFSFGDYFKRGAIRHAWDFSLQILGFDPEKIYITIYLDDDEAEKIWNEEIGIPKNRISRLGKADNWWGPAGDSGPCGPCSELYLDRGIERCTCGNKEKCVPGGECDRYLEYWNLVFNQFNQDSSGNLQPLEQTGIDTGAGLERIAAILNEQESVYDTDELMRIINLISGLTAEIGEHGRIEYSGDNIPAFRVIADHTRTACFAMADGVHPDNTGRGYVIRRIIRRALLYARVLGVHSPLMYKLVEIVSEIYGGFYPELKNGKEELREKIRQEEERFLHTLELGWHKWEEYLSEYKSDKSKIFSGESAFKLYDTFGFPLEMTVELAEQCGLEVDLDTFNSLMQKQRETAQAASRWKDRTLPADFPSDANTATFFTGYENTKSSGRIMAIIQDDSCVSGIQSGEGMIVIDKTPFYAESGGQLGDTGNIVNNSGALFRVVDTRKIGEIHLHAGEMLSGEIKIGDMVDMEIDAVRRDGLAKNHTATHLLNNALREHLGDHIQQTGSLVAPDYLRFDFSNPDRISEEMLGKIENSINQAIVTAGKVTTEELSLNEAKTKGALATFGEKYGERVRVISIGKDGVLSRELCGGTHVKNTSEIRSFHILKESSPGAGNRRIEAVVDENVSMYFIDEFQKTGRKIQDFNEGAIKFLLETGENNENHRDYLLIKATIPDHSEVSNRINSEVNAVQNLVKELHGLKSLIENAEKEIKKYKKKLNATKSHLLLSEVDEWLEQAQDIGTVKCVKAVFEDQDIQNLRKFADSLKEKSRSIVVLLGNRTERGPVLLFMSNKNAVEAGVDCGALVKEVSSLIGGGGGGRPESAQAGGKNTGGLEDALDRAIEILTRKMNES